MKLRSALMMALTEHIFAEGGNPAQAAKRLGVPRARITDLLQGRIARLDLDTLVNMAVAAGLRIEIQVSSPARPKRPNRETLAAMAEADAIALRRRVRFAME